MYALLYLIPALIVVALVTAPGILSILHVAATLTGQP